MTRPLVTILPDTLESLDFEPQCTWGIAPLWSVPRCNYTATWVIHKAACCGRPTAVLDCDKHAAVIFGWIADDIWTRCGYCGVARPARDSHLSWTRL